MLAMFSKPKGAVWHYGWDHSLEKQISISSFEKSKKGLHNQLESSLLKSKAARQINIIYLYS